MKIEVETVKGFQDFLPPESLKREKLKELIAKIYKKYGFLPIETPVVEFDELMRSDNINQEDEAVSDRFKLQDRAGRNLGLRYEFTFQLARIFKMNPNIKLPFRRYQISEVFRDEPIGQGRYRQFTQCDADIIGDDSVEAELDCLAIVHDILSELKIDAEIQVNNRQLLKAIIDSVEITNTDNIMRELDKLDKIGEDNVKANLKKYADVNQIITLFKLLEKNIDFFVKNGFEGAARLKELKEKAEEYGIRIIINPFMIRGLSYYTGNIFEIKVQDKSNTIAAGGRYDRLVGKYLNKEIPAVGISFGLDRLAEAASIKIKTTNSVVVSINADKAALKLAKKLRSQDISCIVFYGKPGKALDYANTMQIENAIFIGESELKKKKFTLRNLETGKESLLGEKNLIEALKNEN